MAGKYTLSLRDQRREEARRKRRGDAPSAKPRHAQAPRTRGDCSQMPRPCPYVSCRHHLFLDVAHNGTIKFICGEDASTLPHLPDTCSLDVAARGPITRDEVAERLFVTRERIRQEEEIALEKLRAALKGVEFDPGQLDMGQEDYEQAPEDQAFVHLDLGEDAEWLKKIMTKWELEDADLT